MTDKPTAAASAPPPVTMPQVQEAIDQAVAAIRQEMAAGAAMGAMKDWVRAEIRLMQEGHSEQTRAELNP